MGIVKAGQISRVLEAFQELLPLFTAVPDGNTMINSHVPGWKCSKMRKEAD